MSGLEYTTQNWEHLLLTIESNLEISKCWMYIIEWSFQEDGAMVSKMWYNCRGGLQICLNVDNDVCAQEVVVMLLVFIYGGEWNTIESGFHHVGVLLSPCFSLMFYNEIDKFCGTGTEVPCWECPFPVHTRWNCYYRLKSG